MASENLIERMEKGLSTFQIEREQLSEKISIVKDELKGIIDSIFDELAREINTSSGETDVIIDTAIREFRAMLKRKTELESVQSRLTPVFEMLKSAH